jgi:hypothetical protein
LTFDYIFILKKPKRYEEQRTNHNKWVGAPMGVQMVLHIAEYHANFYLPIPDIKESCNCNSSGRKATYEDQEDVV